jgi:CheY-specific phosphatase CheX
MPDTPEIAEEPLREHLIQAVTAVLQAAVGVAVQPVAGVPVDTPPDPLEEGAPGAGGGTVAGLVRFAGEAEGLIALQLDLDLAAHCTGLRPGLAAGGKGDALVNEAVGRLAAGVATRLARSLAAAGCECTTGAPAILRGGSLCVEPVSHGDRLWQAFTCPAGRLAADLMIHWSG